MEGRQFSTSRGVVIHVGDFLSRYDPDPLRYFLTAGRAGDAGHRLHVGRVRPAQQRRARRELGQSRQPVADERVQELRRRAGARRAHGGGPVDYRGGPGGLRRRRRPDRARSLQGGARGDDADSRVSSTSTSATRRRGRRSRTIARAPGPCSTSCCSASTTSSSCSRRSCPSARRRSMSCSATTTRSQASCASSRSRGGRRPAYTVLTGDYTASAAPGNRPSSRRGDRCASRSRSSRSSIRSRSSPRSWSAWSAPRRGVIDTHAHLDALEDANADGRARTARPA